jgi:hypothetical protein
MAKTGPVNPYFLSRNKPRPQKNFKSKETIKTFTTHLKGKLCIWETGEVCEGMAETISAIQTVM